MLFVLAPDIDSMKLTSGSVRTDFNGRSIRIFIIRVHMVIVFCLIPAVFPIGLIITIRIHIPGISHRMESILQHTGCLFQIHIIMPLGIAGRSDLLYLFIRQFLIGRNRLIWTI